MLTKFYKFSTLLLWCDDEKLTESNWSTLVTIALQKDMKCESCSATSITQLYVLI